MSRTSLSMRAAMAGALVALCALWSSPVATASPWAPATSAIPIVGPGVPTPALTPGKDFSDYRDRDSLGGADAEQDIAWDGTGGTRDSFDYSGSRPADLTQDMEVDGIANGFDALFHPLRGDLSALIFSVGELGIGGPAGGDPNIYLEHAAAYSGPKPPAIWATAPTIDDTYPIGDVDGLEVWGDDNFDDADRYSLYGDPFWTPPGGASMKVAVWGYSAGISTPHTFTADLAMALDRQFGGSGTGPLFGLASELLDVDAIMVQGDHLTFSVAPIDFTPLGVPVAFDGGEIFEYDGPGSTTRFLFHGGHFWNTIFDVRGTFGVLSENVNAIEAVSVPEPSTFLLLLVAALAAAWVGKRSG